MMVHVLRLENMTLKDFSRKVKEKKTHNTTLPILNGNILDHPLVSKAGCFFPKHLFLRINLLLYPAGQDNSPPPQHSSYSYTVWVLKALYSDQWTEPSFKPATHRRWHPGQPQNCHCFHWKADPQHKSRPSMEWEWGSRPEAGCKLKAGKGVSTSSSWEVRETRAEPLLWLHKLFYWAMRGSASTAASKQETVLTENDKQEYRLMQQRLGGCWKGPFFTWRPVPRRTAQSAPRQPLPSGISGESSGIFLGPTSSVGSHWKCDMWEGR